jgi:serine/threonine protein kinase
VSCFARFDIIKKLGQGTCGKVQLGINKETGQEVAIKTIKKSKIETEADLVRIRREIQIMSSVQHPNIIHIYEGGQVSPFTNWPNCCWARFTKIFFPLATPMSCCYGAEVARGNVK